MLSDRIITTHSHIIRPPWYTVVICFMCWICERKLYRLKKDRLHRKINPNLNFCSLWEHRINGINIWISCWEMWTHHLLLQVTYPVQSVANDVKNFDLESRSSSRSSVHSNGLNTVPAKHSLQLYLTARCQDIQTQQVLFLQTSRASDVDWTSRGVDPDNTSFQESIRFRCHLQLN